MTRAWHCSECKETSVVINLCAMLGDTDWSDDDDDDDNDNDINGSSP